MRVAGRHRIAPSFLRPTMCTLFAFGGGPWDWVIIAGIVFLLFGSRLPKVMRDLGRGVTEFKKGMQGIDEEHEEQEAPPAKIRQPDPVVQEAPKQESTKPV